MSTDIINKNTLRKSKIVKFGIFLIGLAALFFFVIKAYGLTTWLLELGGRIKDTLAFKTGEYLFFIGTTCLSLLCLKKKRWILAKIVFLVGCLWVALHKPFYGFIQNLGGDSFAEVNHFDWHEAIFWLGAAKQHIRPKFYIASFLLYAILAAGAVWLLRRLAKRAHLSAKKYAYAKFVLATIMIMLAVHQTISDTAKFFYQNVKEHATIKQNFTNPLPALIINNKPINVLVYIGESTAIMDMSIYGYPRNTTPNLKHLQLADPNFIVFNNVFSTHTQTSPSLLEALSFAVDTSDSFLPINKRRRCSIVEILGASKLKSKLFSTQNSSGSFNLAAPMIFGAAEKKFSMDTERLGNNSRKELIYDHDFLINTIIKNTPFRDNIKTLTFFHSYAGHGNYIHNTPPAFRKSVDGFFNNKSPRSILGANYDSQKEVAIVNHYDSAVNYIDFSLAQAIDFVKNSAQPAVFLYFSDHGESAYTNEGHDASHFVHEMARIPFLLYFNAAAKAGYPEVFVKYKNLAAKNETATLAQLPATMLDLLGAKIAPQDTNKVVLTPVIGEKALHPPIIVRELADKINFININQRDLAPGINYQKTIVNNTDIATKIFIANHNNKNNDTYICYNHANVFGKARRGSIVANCLAVDLAAQNKKNTKSAVKETLNLAIKNNKALWLRVNTSSFGDFISGYANKLSAPLLIEFPIGFHAHKDQIDPYIKNIKTKKLFFTYAINNNDALICAKALGKGRLIAQEPACLALEKDISWASAGGIFTDLSFDYAGITAIEAIRIAKKFSWNTWSLQPDTISKIKPGGFRMIAPNNSDPNSA
jgi:glucan phosphoethanolaminetransferase (alkaline phosphatase superfamily)